MNVDSIAQILSIVMAAAFNQRAIRREIAKISEQLKNKVDVEDYRKSLAEIWEKHNTLREKNARLEERIAALERQKC